MGNSLEGPEYSVTTFEGISWDNPVRLRGYAPLFRGVRGKGWDPALQPCSLHALSGCRTLSASALGAAHQQWLSSNRWGAALPFWLYQKSCERAAGARCLWEMQTAQLGKAQTPQIQSVALQGLTLAGAHSMTKETRGWPTHTPCESPKLHNQGKHKLCSSGQGPCRGLCQ